jgi:exonuclease III
MRVITWNMNKRRVGNWEWLLEHVDPDVALVQEASPLPKGIQASVRNVKRNHRTVVYTKSNDHETIKLHSDHGMGLLVTQSRGIYFLNVYANLDFKTVDPLLLGLIATYISVLRRKMEADQIIIAGDFNMDRRMDDNPTGSRFAAKGTYPTNSFFDTILDMGFFNCMRKFSDDPVQTHYNNKSKYPWEIDHMFATKDIYQCLKSIEVVAADGLSDHHPIVADFDLK